MTLQRMFMKKKYYIYILFCKNNTYYTGYTTDLERRYQEHVEGSCKCKYTRSFPPIAIAASWHINASLSNILKLEYQIKQLTKAEKSLLIRSPKMLNQLHDMDIVCKPHTVSE